MHTYEVTVADETGEMDDATKQRMATIAAYRLETLEENDGHYPEAGGQFDMLDHLEGPFFWERTDEEMEDDPPTSVLFDIVSVDPAEATGDSGTVSVTVTVPY